VKLRPLVLVLGACLALHPSHGRAQSDTTRALTRTTMRRNPNASRNGPSTGISVGFTGIERAADGTLHTVSYPSVAGLVKGGSGERAGLMVGDTLRTVNGRDARVAPIFPNRVPGARYVLRIRRGGEDREVVLVLPAAPAPATPATPPRQR
jgi:hypothetical protein